MIAAILIARIGKAGYPVFVDAAIIGVLLWILTRETFELNDLRSAGILALASVITGLLALPLDSHLRPFVVPLQGYAIYGLARWLLDSDRKIAVKLAVGYCVLSLALRCGGYDPWQQESF